MYFRGFVYNKNLEVSAGRIAYGNNLLLLRPMTYDQESDVSNLCQVIDANTLQVGHSLCLSLSLTCTHRLLNLPRSVKTGLNAKLSPVLRTEYLVDFQF